MAKTVGSSMVKSFHSLFKNFSNVDVLKLLKILVDLKIVLRALIISYHIIQAWQWAVTKFSITSSFDDVGRLSNMLPFPKNVNFHIITVLEQLVADNKAAIMTSKNLSPNTTWSML